MHKAIHLAPYLFFQTFSKDTHTHTKTNPQKPSTTKKQKQSNSAPALPGSWLWSTWSGKWMDIPTAHSPSLQTWLNNRGLEKRRMQTAGTVVTAAFFFVMFVWLFDCLFVCCSILRLSFPRFPIYPGCTLRLPTTWDGMDFSFVMFMEDLYNK